ncbi:unnamed protein product [[Actinomadura] parvosata subsp. kistnae]|nr:hypothetical protein [Nonomuraea sp. ATCC 55076]SPL95741.1 unnamed protein product [Actinomadura parvosata subsp. kistnae]
MPALWGIVIIVVVLAGWTPDQVIAVLLVLGMVTAPALSRALPS